MKSLNFWTGWSKPEKTILYLSIFVLFTCLSIYLFQFYLGVNGAINWETNTDVVRIEQTLSSFQGLGKRVDIKGSNFLIRTFFNASAIELNDIHAKSFFGLICFAMVLVLTGISFIKKIAWFAAAMTAVGLVLFFFSFDLLESYGFQNNTIFTVGFLLFIGITGFLNLYKENQIALITRLSTIAIVVLSFFYIVITNAQVDLPIYYLTHYSAKSLSLVVFLFAGLVGYDIIASFFYIITSTKSSSTTNTLINFLVISTLYLGSLLIFFLNKINYINWNLTLFNPFILLFISTIFGFWGQHKRRELFLDVVNYRKGGIWIFMGIAILSISSITYAFQTSNTAMIASFEEGIIYTHLTMGAAFIIYVMKNYRVPILQGIPVWAKLYFPSRLTHRFTRFIGFGTIILLVVVDQKIPVRRWKAGLYNYKADVYQQEGEYLLAKQNYQLAYAFYPNNFKAHYTLAMTAFEHGDIKKTIKLFKDMVRFRQPNEYALVNLANAYGANEDYYNAQFTLKKAMTEYPDNGYLQNNLAFYSEKEKDLAPVYATYNLAQKNLTKENQRYAYSNLLAFSSNLEKGKVTDSLINAIEFTREVEVVSNRLALANLYAEQFEHDLLIFNDTLLNVQETSYLINGLNNYLHNPIFNKKTSIVLNQNSENKDLLLYAMAVNAARNNKYLLVDSLIKQTITSAKPSVEPYYYFESGKIYLAFGDTKKAEVCFKESYKNQPFNPLNDAPIYLAKIYLTTGKVKEGVELLQELIQFEATKEQANHLLYALSFTEPTQLDSLPKEVLNDVASFNPWFIRSNMLSHLLKKGKLNESVALASLSRAIENEKYNDADLIFDAVHSLESVNKSPFVKLRLEQLAIQKRYKEMVVLSSKKELKGYDLIYEPYFDALIAERLGNTILAEKYYKTAMENTPFYEPLGLSIVNFYIQTKKDEKLAYQALLDLMIYHQMSLEYNFMFIHLALSQGEFFFADETFNDIETLQLMEPKALEEYREIYTAKRKNAIEVFEDTW